MTVFCSVGCSQYVGHWKHHLWRYYRSQEQARLWEFPGLLPSLKWDILFSDTWMKVLSLSHGQLQLYGHKVSFSWFHSQTGHSSTNHRSKAKHVREGRSVLFLVTWFCRGLPVFPGSPQNALASGSRTRHKGTSRRSAQVTIGESHSQCRLLGLWLLRLNIIWSLE